MAENKKLLFDKFAKEKEQKELEEDIKQKLLTEEPIIIKQVPKSKQIIDLITRVVVLILVIGLVAVAGFWLVSHGASFLKDSGLINLQ